MEEIIDENALPAMSMNVSVPTEATKQNDLIKTDDLAKCFVEIFDDIRDDRKELDDVLRPVIDMVLNDGDSTAASKEAMVNLLKIKSDMADKKIKATDLLLRAYLKEKDSGFPKYLAQSQHNYFDDGSKRRLLKSFQEKAKDDEQK